jgi:hypothetical protein
MLVFSVAMVATTQKPVHEERMFVTYRPSPSSLSEMAMQAQSVVVASYGGASRFVNRSSVASVPLVMTGFTLQVERVLKNTGETVLQVSTPFEIFIEGGEHELPDRVRRLTVQGIEPLKPNHRYVVFLKENSRGELTLPWGPYSIFDVTSGRVGSLIDNAEGRRFDGKVLAEFLKALHH